MLLLLLHSLRPKAIVNTGPFVTVSDTSVKVLVRFINTMTAICNSFLLSFGCKFVGWKSLHTVNIKFSQNSMFKIAWL